ncbi:cytochrome d ubiquinol oxidase subunit II [Teredinibacter turnerae]|uniref:cytochrome d ubiquinol oxidase subunit II n=1 Tax=Teredinibacter turnerae TaxID=2426 RepID=UPI0003FCE6DA|nr:cytochrome d ubiquinol oxidase subunit II [Teredinibacter turnerae]
MSEATLLPVIFIGLMGLAILVYALLDGYDLGVGILLPMKSDEEHLRDRMIASIGPFWDANETWLVLAVGLLLIAFPSAHSLVLYHLYLPATFMLLGLILRGVAFDFRAKAAVSHKYLWDLGFKSGSLLTTLTQGYMLGKYVTGFIPGWGAEVFCLLSALGVTAAYTLIGGAWLVLKTESDLQGRAIRWARNANRLTFLGVIAVCLVNLWVNPSVFQRWFEFPLVMFVLLIPAICLAAFMGNEWLLRKLPFPDDRYCAYPFAFTAVIFTTCFTGLAFSFYPAIVPGKLTIWEAASAPESLQFILVGALVVVPVILIYTAYAYWVFRGKASDLKYH